MSKLRLHGTSSGYTDIAPTAAAGNNTLTAPTSTGTLVTEDSNGDISVNLGIVHTGDTDTKIKFPAADTITAETGGTERLRIDSSGDITAVNTTSGGTTGVTLKVGASAASGTNSGTIIINNGGLGNASLQFDYEGSAARAKIYTYRSTNDIIFDTSSTEKFRFTDAAYLRMGGGGRIGINTAGVNPYTDLHIANRDANLWLGNPLSGFSNNQYPNLKIICDDPNKKAYIDQMYGGDNAYDRNITFGGSYLALHSPGGSNGAETVRILGDQVLMGATSAYNNFENASTAPRLQVRGTNLSGSCQAWIRATADAGAPKLFMGNSRSTSQSGHTVVQNGDELGQLTFCGSDGTQFVNGCEIRGAVDGTPGADDMPGRLTFHTTNDGGASGVERLRIDSFGRVYCNTTAQGPHGSFYTIKATDKSTNGLSVQGTTANYVYVSSAGGSTGDHIYFSNWSNSNTETGRIKDDSSNVTYYTTSDYRLKENVVAISDAFTRVKQLNPVRHTWKNNSGPGTVDGWIAHELDAVCPYAVDGVKDAVKDDGSIDPQAVDYGRISPLLAAALKEAITAIETLQDKVAALESA